MLFTLQYAELYVHLVSLLWWNTDFTCSEAAVANWDVLLIGYHDWQSWTELYPRCRGRIQLPLSVIGEPANEIPTMGDALDIDKNGEPVSWQLREEKALKLTTFF